MNKERYLFHAYNLLNYYLELLEDSLNGIDTEDIEGSLIGAYPNLEEIIKDLMHMLVKLDYYLSYIE